MSPARPRTRQRVGAAALAPVALLSALWAGSRVEHALQDHAVSVAVGGSAPSPPASRVLSDREVHGETGFAGPDRPEEAPVPQMHESRTWFAAGRWWAVLNREGDGALTIWGLPSADGPWVDTGVLVDDREFVGPIVAWTGSVLVVASSGTRSYDSHALRTNRFRWDTAQQRWRQMADFPVTASATPVPGIRMLVEPSGSEWLARQEGDGIVVARSSPSGLDHTGFAPLPDGVGASDVGGFDLIGSGSTVHLVWRSVSADRVHVATWSGSVWSTEAYEAYGVGGVGPVTVSSTGTAPGRPLLVLVPTSLAERGRNDQDTALLLLAIDGRTIRTSTVSRVQDQLQDAALVVDADGSRVHVLATHPPPVDSADGVGPTPVVAKTAAIGDLAFSPGLGRPVLYGDVGTRLAAPVVPNGFAEADRGLLVMAAGQDLSGWRTAVVGGHLAVGPLRGGTGTVDVVHDTFDGLPSRAPTPAAWHAGTSQPLTSTIVTAPGTGRGMLIENADGDHAPLACRAVPLSSSPVLVRADVITAGTGATDARLLTVRGPDGSLASARLSRKGEAGWSGPDGRVLAGTVAHGTPLRVTIQIDPRRHVASIRIETGSGVVAEGFEVPLLAAGTAGVDEVCVGPGANDPGASILLTDLLVRQG